MNNGPTESGYYWVQRVNGLRDVAVWDVAHREWMVLGYEDCVSHERSGIVAWQPLTPPGPTEQV